MNKAVKNTIVIITIIILSVGLGYAYDKITTAIEKRSYPLMYVEIVEQYAEEYGVPKEIVYSVIKAESSFRSDAESKHAIGLMQITPDTFDWLMKRMGENLSHGLLYDPHTNIKYGTYYLNYLYKEFSSWDIAFAAYNAGPNKVKRDWLNDPQYIQNNEVVYIPYEETRNYIKKVNRNIEAYKRLYFTKN